MGKKLVVIALTVVLSAALVGGFTMAWFTDSGTAGQVEFTAGTVLIEADTSGVIHSQYFEPTEATYVYGVEAVTGDLYEIDVQNGTANMFFDTDMSLFYPAGNPDQYSPNGLAFDNANRRLYFSIRKGSNSELWFYDFLEKELAYAGSIQGITIYGAAFGQGHYWYVKNSSDDLWKVGFNPDGTISPSSIQKVADLNNNASFNFGDIALDYRNGVIYGCTSNGNNSILFSYDLSTGDYQEIRRHSTMNLQIAYGSDGTLYGHSTSLKKWYSVDPLNSGATVELFLGTNSFNDLASGYISVWNPGDCSKLKYEVLNRGSKTSYVRALLSGYWLSYDVETEEWVDWTPPADVVTITRCDDTPWEQSTDGYIYYQGILNANQTVELCVNVCLDGPGTTNEFQGKRFVVTAEFDAIQTTNGASEALGWNLDL